MRTKTFSGVSDKVPQLEMVKKLVFIDIGESAIPQSRADIKLTPFPMDGTLQSAKLVFYQIEGVTLTFDGGTYVRSRPHYFQLKFSGALRSSSLTHDAHPDMLQLPIQGFVGGGTSMPPIELHLDKRHFSPDFTVEIFDEGPNPLPLSLHKIDGHLLLWIELDISPVPVL